MQRVAESAASVLALGGGEVPYLRYLYQARRRLAGTSPRRGMPTATDARGGVGAGGESRDWQRDVRCSTSQEWFGNRLPCDIGQGKMRICCQQLCATERAGRSGSEDREGLFPPALSLPEPLHRRGEAAWQNGTLDLPACDPEWPLRSTAPPRDC